MVLFSCNKMKGEKIIWNSLMRKTIQEQVMAKKNEIKQYLEENKDKIISHYGEMGGNVFEGIKKHLQNPSHIAFLMGYDIIKIELSKHGVGDNNRASNDTYYLPNNPKDIYLMEE